MIIHSDLYCKHTYRESASILSDCSCNNAYMKSVGEILKEAREQLGLSQEKVAAQVRKLTRDSFSRAALAQIESGSTKNPTPQNLQAACDALGIDFRSALNGNLVKSNDYIDGEVVCREAELQKHINNPANNSGLIPKIQHTKNGYEIRPNGDYIHIKRVAFMLQAGIT